MSNTQLYTDSLQTLKSVTLKALAQSKKSRVNYWLMFELAIDGYRFLNLHAITDGKEWKKLTPDSNGMIYFPSDFEDFIGLYVPINGELYPLTRNDKIITTTSLSGLTEIQDPTIGEGVDGSNGVSYGPSARGGVNLQGYYTIDWSNTRIFTKNIANTHLILLYKTSGTRITDETHVLSKYIPFLVAFICFEHTKYDDTYPVYRRQELLNSLNTERVNLARLTGPTLTEYMDAIRSTYYSTAKRG